MNILTFNLEWMSWNIFLAVVGMVFGLLLRRPHHKTIKALWAFLWLIFIPNSIYIVTDIYHLTYQLERVHYALSPILVFQYMVLLICGIITFVVGMLSLERELHNLGINKQIKTVIIIIFNFLISFGVTLGRFQRTNSWETFTHPFRVVYDILGILFSLELMAFVLVFGIFCNVLYFGIRKKLLFVNKYDSNSSHRNRRIKKRK